MGQAIYSSPQVYSSSQPMSISSGQVTYASQPATSAVPITSGPVTYASQPVAMSSPQVYSSIQSQPTVQYSTAAPISSGALTSYSLPPASAATSTVFSQPAYSQPTYSQPTYIQPTTVQPATTIQTQGSMASIVRPGTTTVGTTTLTAPATTVARQLALLSASQLLPSAPPMAQQPSS